MRTLLFVRHSLPRIDPARPPAEWSLTPAGRAAAAELGSTLAPYGPRRVFASPEPKALETARILAAALALDECDVEVADGLREHDRTGVPFFDSPGEFERRVEELFARRAQPVLGSESAERAGARFRRAVLAALDTRPFSCMAFVTHGTVMSLFLGQVMGCDPLGIWRRLTTPCYVAIAWPDGRPLGGVPLSEVAGA